MQDPTKRIVTARETRTRQNKQTQGWSGATSADLGLSDGERSRCTPISVGAVYRQRLLKTV